MDLNWRSGLQKILTVAYLISAFVVTAATSKQGDGSVSGLVTGATNYSVQSNCLSRPANIRAFRIDSGAFTQTLDANGAVDGAPTLDFTRFGFPQPQVIVGVNQYGSGATANRSCTVRSKQMRPNTSAVAAGAADWFIEPGQLTTVVYDCYEANAFVCTTILSELPAGDLRSSALN